MAPADGDADPGEAGDPTDVAVARRASPCASLFWAAKRARRARSAASRLPSSSPRAWRAVPACDGFVFLITHYRFLKEYKPVGTVCRSCPRRCRSLQGSLLGGRSRAHRREGRACCPGRAHQGRPARSPAQHDRSGPRAVLLICCADAARRAAGGPQTSCAERFAQLVEGRCTLGPLRGGVHTAGQADVGALVGERVTPVDEDGG
jgi:hypothetical protein